MTWPPTIPPADITNTTEQDTRHPDDHNQISAALATLTARLSLPAPGATTGGGASFTGTYTNIVTAAPAAPTDPDAYPCVLLAWGSVQYFPRSAGELHTQFQLLVGATVSPAYAQWANPGTQQPQYTTNSPTVIATHRLAARPGTGVVDIILRAASLDSITYPTSANCLLGWAWQSCV